MASENHTLAIETGHLSPCIPVDSMKGPSKNLILCSDGTGNRGRGRSIGVDFRYIYRFPKILVFPISSKINRLLK